MKDNKKKRKQKMTGELSGVNEKSPMFSQKEPGVSDSTRVVYSEEPNRLDG